MIRDSLLLAGLAARRFFRSRAKWLVLLLLFAPTLAGIIDLEGRDPEMLWQGVSEAGLRFYVLLAAALTLAGCVSEEVEGSTLSYLWSRPVSRPALLLGKLAALWPILVAGAVASFTLAYVVVTGADERLWGALLRTLGAAAAGTLAAGAFAMGIGTLFWKKPFLVAVGYVLVIENILAFVPNAAELSFLHHARVLAGLPVGNDMSPSATYSLVSLLVMTGLWLGLGSWRVSSAEYGKVK